MGCEIGGLGEDGRAVSRKSQSEDVMRQTQKVLVCIGTSS
jgi:hypothetical protein